MANLVLGVGTSHGPMLNTPPDQWGGRAVADRRNPALIYRGEEYTFDELNELRGAGFADQCQLGVWQRRHVACRTAIATVGQTILASDLDALVVVSSDHKEVFGDELLPQFAFYYGDTVQHEPYTQGQLDRMPPGLAVAEVANQPDVSTTRTCHSRLALHLIRETSAAGFDPAASQKLPAGEWENHGLPHGWGFVYQQMLGGSGNIPLVPLFVNTFWQPNPPSAARCYDFGAALGEAITSFPEPLRVGIVASGGLSHMVIDEELDRSFLQALVSRDRKYLASLPDTTLRSGTSELRSWVVVAAALENSALRPRVIEYQPCYRSAAGTGCAMGFAMWENPGRTGP